MSNPSVLAVTLPAAVATGIAASQSLAAAGKLTLNGSLASGGVANLVVAQRVFIASAGNDSGLTWTVTGTSRYGYPQSESFTGGNIATVHSYYDYLTVTAISGSAATASTVTAGTGAIGSSEWVLDNFLAPNWALSVAVAVTGTASFSVEHVYDDPNATAQSAQIGALAQYSLAPGSVVPPVLWSLAALTNKSANAEAQYTGQPIIAHRLTVLSGTGTVRMWTVQAGIGAPL